MENPKVEDVELLLEAARKAVPRKLESHPCTVRCPRVGGPCDVYPNGKCMECSGTAYTFDDRDLQNLVEEKPNLVLSLCESFLLMRRLLDHPAVMAASHAAHAKGKTNAL